MAPKTTTPPTERRTTTPPRLAARWGVNVDKVLFFIRTGELRAFDASLLPGRGRPRYMIDLADVEAFERGRQVHPALPTTSRKRRQPEITRHFR